MIDNDIKYYVDNFKEDCERIVSIMKQNDVIMTLSEAAEFWSYYSEEYYCAGWLTLSHFDHHIYNSFLNTIQDLKKDNKNYMPYYLCENEEECVVGI